MSCLARRLDDLGVDHHVRAVALVEVVGEEALAHADLRRREPDAFLDSIVSYMASTSGTRSPVMSSTSRARCFSTGSPNVRSGYAVMRPSYPLSAVISDPAGIDVDPQPTDRVGRVDLGQRERVAQPA